MNTSLPLTADMTFQPGDIVFATDVRGRLLFWNREAEETTGHRSDEVLGSPYALACGMMPGDIDLLAIIAGRDYAGGVRCRSRSGGEMALYLYATCGRNSAGEPAGVVFVARDVTGLWRVEEAARASADKYRLLFEHTLDSVAIADLDGRVLEANPACLRLYGYTAMDVRRVNLVDLVAPEDRDVAAKVMAALAQGNRVQPRALRMRRKDGTGLVVELTAYVVALGGEKRIFSVTRDVTERTRAEAALTESERRYRAVFESASDAVFIESVDGRILDVNRNGCELLGYRKEELLRKNVSDLVPAAARAWLPHVVDALLRMGSYRGEAVNVHKGGREIPVEVSLSTMEMDGRTAVLATLRDITERKLAEQTLRESEEKFRSVSEQSPNMIFINCRGRVVYANQKSVDVMGYAREEFYAPGFDFMKLIAPDSVERIGAAYARHARGEDVEPYEYALVTRDGRRIESIITTRLIDYQGTKAILGIVTDIAARKAGEQALRESEENFRALAEGISDGVATLDAEGRFTFVNGLTVERSGRPRDWWLGRHHTETVPPEHRERLERVFAAVLRGEKVEPYELPYQTADGRTVYIEATAAALRRDGAIVGAVAVNRDVTKRKLAELALAESEEKYRSVVERASDGICVIQDGRLRYLNRRLAEMAGYAPEELTGKEFAEYLHPDDRAGVGDRYRRRLAGEQLPSTYTVRFLRRAGGAVTVEVNAAVATFGGAPADIVLVRDVSERERLARAAEETADELRAVLDNSPMAIAGECEGVLVYANQRFARLFGYESPAEVIGRTAADFDAPEDRGLLAEYSRLREQGKDAPTSYLFRGLRRDGTTVPMQASISTYRSLGRLHILGFIREVEERPGC